MPVLSELKQKGDEAALQDFLDHVAGALLAVVVVVTGLGILLAPWIARLFLLFADEATSDIVPLTAEMLRITFPYLTFISMTALAGAVLNSFRHFGLPAFTPVLHNLGVIAAHAAAGAATSTCPKWRWPGACSWPARCNCCCCGRRMGALGPATAAEVQPAPRRRAPGVQADAADDLFLVGGAGEPAGRHHVRLAAGAGGAVAGCTTPIA